MTYQEVALIISFLLEKDCLRATKMEKVVTLKLALKISVLFNKNNY